MSEKDLGEGIEKFEEEVENLKNTKMKLFGITMTPTTIGAAFALVSTIVGGLYGSFEVYNDYMEMKEQIQSYQAPDLSGIEERISVVDQKMEGVLAEVKVMKDSMNDTADRVSDIKGDLREDIVRVEKIVDEVEDSVKKVQDDVRVMIQNAEERFENKRDALQNDYDQAKDRLQTNTQNDLDRLEKELNDKLQKALDNPLAN